jgi:hypothetical protein
MSGRLLTAAIAAAVVAAPAADARADRREASLHGHLVAGALATGDVDAGAATDRVPLLGLALRASYTTRDRFQYDVALSLLGAGAAAFPAHTFAPPGRPPVTGPYQVGSLVTRLDGGVTLRLGVRWIPTVRLGAGLQLRRVGEARVAAGAGTFVGRDPRLELDLVGTATVGLDHRVHRRLVVGVAAGGSLAVAGGGASTHTVEVTVHGAYSWYPRW